MESVSYRRVRVSMGSNPTLSASTPLIVSISYEDYTFRVPVVSHSFARASYSSAGAKTLGNSCFLENALERPLPISRCALCPRLSCLPRKSIAR